MPAKKIDVRSHSMAACGRRKDKEKSNAMPLHQRIAIRDREPLSWSSADRSLVSVSARSPLAVSTTPRRTKRLERKSVPREMAQGAFADFSSRLQLINRSPHFCLLTYLKFLLISICAQKGSIDLIENCNWTSCTSFHKVGAWLLHLQ